MQTRPEVVVDRSSPVPLYFQVAEQFEHAIVSGALRPGDKLDNEIALAKHLGLSRPTMRQAIQLLVDKGMLVRKRGVGTQVVHGRVRRSLELTSLYDDLVRIGEKPRTEILSLERRAADEEVATALGIAEGSEIWSLERLRFIGQEPLAVMRNDLPTRVADVAAFDLEEQGLYASLRRAGVLMSVAKQRIGARRALAGEAGLLQEKRGAPLLTMERTAYDNGGLAVEFGRHVYRPELYSFELTLVDR
ncbi:MAG: GntR family transcriptional regulator [Nocardioides sp.]|nr:GntR family transcriptional regulator [Nocardioides sp.]